MLPNNIYFTGAPGSMWSAIASKLQLQLNLNVSDRLPSRRVKDKNIRAFANHTGMYFGQVEGFPSTMDRTQTDLAFTYSSGCKILKSHDWSYKLDHVKDKLNDDWIVMVFRPSHDCLVWWNKQGGFDIDYPLYTEYKDNIKMMYEIQQQNKLIMEFAYKHQLSWNFFTAEWIDKHFGYAIEEVQYNKTDVDNAIKTDTLVAIYKPEEHK